MSGTTSDPLVVADVIEELIDGLGSIGTGVMSFLSNLIANPVLFAVVIGVPVALTLASFALGIFRRS